MNSSKSNSRLSLLVTMCFRLRKLLFTSHFKRSWVRRNTRSILFTLGTLLLSIVIPYNIMFYTRGCQHTKLFYNPYSPETFKHGHPKQTPSHLYPVSEQVFGQGGVDLAIDLLSSRIQPSVHYVWCNQGYFQFQHYLSILSVFKFLRPAQIYFHYTLLPDFDSYSYYQFFTDLRKDLPNLVFQQLSQSQACSDQESKLSFVTSLLSEKGGIFVDENVIISSSLSDLRKKPFSFVGSSDGIDVILMEKGYLKSRNVKFDLNTLLSQQETPSYCDPHTSYRAKAGKWCIRVTKEIFPFHIFELDTDFGQLARQVGYGKAAKLQPLPATKAIIPRLVHYVWLGNRAMKLFDYLSLVSSLYIHNADYVYIHGDIEPTGPYWQRMKRHPRVSFLHRHVPQAVFSQPIAKYLAHASDYLRADLLIRYGGTYVDWDIIWVQEVPEKFRHYETMACPDFPYTGTFPDVFNMGVLMAARGSQYLRYFLESYKHYLDNDWSYNAIHMPYKVYEKHPDLLLVERHLQVICAVGKCHPTWLPGYKDFNVHHLNSAPFDWKTETYAIHWTYPDPEEFESEENLVDSNTMFAQIGKYIISKSGSRLQQELS